MNKTIITAILFLLISVASASAQLNTIFTTQQINQMLVESIVSLGNSTCSSMECDSMQMNFLVPKGLEGTFKVSFKGICFSPEPNSTETYSVNAWCSDGSTHTIDLKEADCESLNYAELPHFWVEIKNVTSQQFYSDIVYQQFFCSFSRDSSNIDRIPTEFKVIIDSLGLSSQSEDENIISQRSAISTIIDGIKDVIDINVQIWRIIFNIFQITILLVAFLGIPIMLIKLIRWAIESVREMTRR